MRLENKVAIITGAASRMGEAIAKLYAKEGAKVVVADYNLQEAEEVTTKITNEGGTAKVVQVDVADSDDIDLMFNTALDAFGRLDILINNAGIMDGFEPVGEITDEKWDRIFDVNTKSMMRSMRKAVNYWIENDQEGVILNTISTGDLNGAHAGVAYGASKHAVVALTKNTGFVYAKRGIRVIGIAPGSIETNIGSTNENTSEFGIEQAGQTHALSPRNGKPFEVAQAAVFLGSDEASFINGAILTVGGGWTAAF